MDFPFSEFRKGTFSPYIKEIKELFSAMDAAYEQAAERYGFKCRGCSETCCEERFFHYTLAEHIYLLTGVRSLSSETAALALARAEEAKRTYQLQDLHGGSGRVMCPLNFNGLCGLYDHRPMICRLHGIPHRLHKPGGPEQKGPGCGRFHKETQAGDHYGHEFDRTEFYSGMAAIEIGLRRRLNFRGRYRKTIADMVLDILNGDG